MTIVVIIILVVLFTLFDSVESYNIVYSSRVKYYRWYSLYVLISLKHFFPDLSNNRIESYCSPKKKENFEFKRILN